MTTDLEDADRLERQKAGACVMALRRWTLPQAIIWTATRSAEATALRSTPFGLALWCRTFPGSYPAPRWEDAWVELAAAMARGAVSAFASEIQRDRVTGSREELPGVQFPPKDQPGLGLACFVANEPPRTVVRPNGWLFAARWTEYADLSLERGEVVAAFPAIGVQSFHSDQTEAPQEPGSLSVEHLPLTPAQGHGPRLGSQVHRVCEVIAEVFPAGIGKVPDSAIRKAINSTFGPEDRGIKDHTIRRGIKAARAADAA